MPLRKANKDHVCTERSYHTIRKGDVYFYFPVTPWHEFNETGKYQDIKACIRCAKEYGMMNSDERKQLGQPNETRGM